jgi:predicted acyl esterase
VGLVGNSHLAIIQWFIAALNPPSLTCIAPWEGCGDLYREQFARGGIYGGELFDNMITKWMLKGRNGMESFRKMYDKSPNCQRLVGRQATRHEENPHPKLNPRHMDQYYARYGCHPWLT